MSKAHSFQSHLKCLNFEVALTIGSIIITPNVSVNKNPLTPWVLLEFSSMPITLGEFSPTYKLILIRQIFYSKFLKFNRVFSSSK